MREYVRKTLRLLGAHWLPRIFLSDGPQDLFHTVKFQFKNLLQLISQFSLWKSLLSEPNQVMFREFR